MYFEICCQYASLATALNSVPGELSLLRGLLLELDLGQHAHQQLVDVVVDARRRLDVLAAVPDRQRLPR